MPIKQIGLRGISRNPDDAASDNGSLMHCVDMVNDGVGLRLIEKPHLVFSLSDGEDCIMIHETPLYRHYIILVANALKWCDAGDYGARKDVCAVSGDLKSISAIGNTIVYCDDEGIKYALWSNDDGAYRELGSHPDMVEIQFGLRSEFIHHPDGTKASYNATVRGGSLSREHFVPLMDGSFYENVGTNEYPAYALKTLTAMNEDGKGVWAGYDFSLKDKEYYNYDNTDIAEVVRNGMTDAVLASVNKFIASATKKNQFIFPFFVRYAYELYDGSMTMHSYPVLLIPDSKGPLFAIDRRDFRVTGENKSDRVDYTIKFSGNTFGFVADLMMKIIRVPDNISQWKDIVKSVGIYVTAPIYTYDQAGKVEGWHNMEDVAGDGTQWDDYYSISSVSKVNTNYGRHEVREAFASFFPDFLPAPSSSASGVENIRLGDKFPCWVADIPQKDISDIMANIQDAGQYYKLAEIGFDDLIKLKDGKHKDYTIGEIAKLKINDNILDTLQARQQMVDDYHSHDTLSSSHLYVYNQRLNLGGVTRTHHKPISPLLQMPIKDGGTGYSCKVAVWVRNDGGGESVLVSDVAATHTNDIAPEYLFYPDRRAYKAMLMYRGELYDVKLTEHKTLEGAFWAAPIWHDAYADGWDISGGDFPKAAEAKDYAKQKIYTSNTENPFSFTPANINTVGDGEVMAMCANTQPVNAYNFGYATMYAFTTKGIWGLKVSDTGGYQSVQPVSRDVITEGTQPLATDTSIFFLTTAGVKVLQINSSQPKMVSAELDFASVAKLPQLTNVARVTMSGHDAVMGIVDGDMEGLWRSSDAVMAYDYRHGRVYLSARSKFGGSLVYNLRSGMWSESTTRIDTALNAWPSCEFVFDGDVLCLDGDTRKTEGLVVTRPIKTGGEFFARLKETAVRGNFGAQAGGISTAMFGSRDWRLYALLGTSKVPRITRHFGSGFRSHIVAVAVNTPEPVSLDYIALDVEGGMTDKIR